MDLDIGCSFVFGVPAATHAVMLFEPHSTDQHRVVDSRLTITRDSALPPSTTYVDSYGNRCRRINFDIGDAESAVHGSGTTLIRPCGHVANVGVHGKPATLHLETLWTRDVTITTGLVDTYSTPTLLRLATGGQLSAAQFVTHHFAMDDMLEAYDTFSRAADTGALKVVITPGDKPAA